jgi:glutaredoxin-related protein
MTGYNAIVETLGKNGTKTEDVDVDISMEKLKQVLNFNSSSHL